jgi:hypothetical protein
VNSLVECGEMCCNKMLFAKQGHGALHDIISSLI